MGYEFTTPKGFKRAEDKFIDLEDEREYRVEFQQISIIPGKKEVHITANIFDKATLELRQRTFILRSDDYPVAKQAVTLPDERLFEALGRVVWDYVISKEDDVLVYGVPLPEHDARKTDKEVTLTVFGGKSV